MKYFGERRNVEVSKEAAEQNSITMIKCRCNAAHSPACSTQLLIELMVRDA